MIKKLLNLFRRNRHPFPESKILPDNFTPYIYAPSSCDHDFEESYQTCWEYPMRPEYACWFVIKNICHKCGYTEEAGGYDYYLSLSLHQKKQQIRKEQIWRHM